MNAHRETICSCWILNRWHCVFCSLIKFHMTLPVGMLNGRGFGPGGSHREMTSVQGENSMTEQSCFIMQRGLQRDVYVCLFIDVPLAC